MYITDADFAEDLALISNYMEMVTIPECLQQSLVSLGGIG